MKVGIIQLSDIHISLKDNFIINKSEVFVRSCKTILNSCSKLIIVITGDIANTGSEDEYTIAYKFLKQCEQLIYNEADLLKNSIEYVIVPGNHDCKFSEDPIRDMIIKSQTKEDSINEQTFIDQCINPQNDFWLFYNQLTNSNLKPSISYEIIIPLTIDENLIFNCYNTSLFSSIKEVPGSLVVPENYFLNPTRKNKKDIVISLYHHNTGWLSPNTPHNNKKSFESHLFNHSNIVMCGHEHSKVQIREASLSSQDELLYLESSAFQYENNSAYNIIVLDTNNNNYNSYNYNFSQQEQRYIQADEYTGTIIHKIQGISISQTFKDSLIKIDVPLKHPNKQDLTLTDIFIYPDLEPLLELEDKYGEYIDSEKLVNDKNDDKIIFIEGTAQSGKTSLLRMLYLNYYESGYYPLTIQGSEIKNINVLDIIKRSYKKQYNYKNFSFQQYMELDKSRHIILIDNLDESSLNEDGITIVLDKMLDNFDKILITTSDQTDLKSLLIRSNKDSEIKRYKLLSLGYYKRNKIIERWLSLGMDPYTLNKSSLEKEIKLTFDQISNLLGEQLIPSYPIYILTLLQSLNQSLKSFDVSETSYAYCYNSLIIAALIQSKAGSDNIKGLMNILTELAYYLYAKDSRYITKNDFDSFYNSYKEKYCSTYTLNGLIKLLCISNILRETDSEVYKFTYKYIYYFLVAKKISTLVGSETGDTIIKELCANMHKEKEANILIFLVHHNDNNTLIEELLFASMLPFENYTPITLDTHDKIFQILSNLVEVIKSEILIKDIDPRRERESTLKESDKINRSHRNNQNENISIDEINKDPNLRDINHTFKVTKILGQIIKNQKGTFEKERLISLIIESYNVCFRSINFFTSMLDKNKDDIIDFIIDNSKIKFNGKINTSELKDKVSTLLRMMLYRVCLTTFSNLSLAVGTSKMDEIYEEVANRIGSPAAKLISFTIKTYYGTMKISELENLAKDFKNNPVAMNILKARVIKYVYNNYVDFKDKQAIGKICNLQLINQIDVKKAK